MMMMMMRDLEAYDERAEEKTETKANPHLCFVSRFLRAYTSDKIRLLI
jgi:hypothetical protein